MVLASFSGNFAELGQFGLQRFRNPQELLFLTKDQLPFDAPPLFPHCLRRCPRRALRPARVPHGMGRDAVRPQRLKASDLRHPGGGQPAGAAADLLLHGAQAQATDRGHPTLRALPADDAPHPEGGGLAARPRLHGPSREQLQQPRPLPEERSRPLAVHRLDGAHLRTPD